MSETVQASVKESLEKELIYFDTSGFKIRAKELTQNSGNYDISVNAFFKTLREMLEIERNPAFGSYETVFYDMNKKAGGDGHTSAIDRRKTALIELDMTGVITKGPEGEEVLNHSSSNRQQIPFIKIQPDEKTKARLIILANKYNIQIGESKIRNGVYIISPSPACLTYK